MSKTKGLKLAEPRSFAKTSSRKSQKLHKMKTHSKTRRHYLGGSPDAPLAYTGKPIFSVPNPNLAYTGKGGSSCGLSNPVKIPVNTNAENPAYPNTGPIPAGNDIIFNNPANQIGGLCGSCNNPLMKGGKKGGSCGLCAMGFMVGGSRHRNGCKCSECKKRRSANMKGGNRGIPYPDGLVGSPIETGKVGGLPGENGIPGDRNYIPYNTYNTDISRQMVDLGANPPFLKGGRSKRKQKGGTLTNFISQDLINLGRQFQFGIGSAYNALAGYAAPINPLPWKDQMQTKTYINPNIRAL